MPRERGEFLIRRSERIRGDRDAVIHNIGRGAGGGVLLHRGILVHAHRREVYDGTGGKCPTVELDRLGGGGGEHGGCPFLTGPSGHGPSMRRLNLHLSSGNERFPVNIFFVQAFYGL